MHGTEMDAIDPLAAPGAAQAALIEFCPDLKQAENMMRFMILLKADKDTEAGVMPSHQLLADMGKFNEELIKAGVMQAGEGLHPSSKGARVRFSGGKVSVTEGP